MTCLVLSVSLLFLLSCSSSPINAAAIESTRNADRSNDVFTSTSTSPLSSPPSPSPSPSPPPSVSTNKNVSSSSTSPVAAVCSAVEEKVTVLHPDRPFRRRCNVTTTTKMCAGYCRSYTELNRRNHVAIRSHCTCCVPVETSTFLVPLVCIGISPMPRPTFVPVVEATKCRCKPCNELVNLD